MRIVGGIVASLVAVGIGLPLFGVSAREAGEYTVVLARRAVTAVFGKGIKPDIELDRLELLLAKSATQLSQHQRAVALAKVDLQDAESAQAKAVADCRKLKGDLHKLRSLLAASESKADGTDGVVASGQAGEGEAEAGLTVANVTVSDGKSRMCVVSIHGRSIPASRIRQAMTDKLASYKQSAERCETLERALEERRLASRKLEDRLADWQAKRVQLAQRLETLKLRRQTQALQSHIDTSVFDDADLARATAIADSVERELRIAETQQEMQTDPVADLVNEPATDVSVDEEVEQILKDGV